MAVNRGQSRRRAEHGAAAAGGGDGKGERKRARKGLGADHGRGMTQLCVVEALAGEAAARAIQVASDTDPDSEGSDTEGRVQPVVHASDTLAMRHATDIAQAVFGVVNCKCDPNFRAHREYLERIFEGVFGPRASGSQH